MMGKGGGWEIDGEREEYREGEKEREMSSKGEGRREMRGNENRQSK